MRGFLSSGRNRPAPPRATGSPAASGAAARRLRLPGLVGLCGALVLAGCAETGDLGRAKRSAWNDLILPAAGTASAWARGEPASSYPFTDDENELRDRAWRFLMPEAERGLLDRSLANLVRNRVLPRSFMPGDRAAYHGSLVSDGFRSPASRYRRLSEDAAADGALVGPFAAVAARVIAADAARVRGLQHVRDLKPGQAEDAVVRVAENRCLVAWVRHEAGRRAERYGTALEHLFIEAPQNEAAPAERVVRAFDAQRATLDALPVPPVEVACVEGGRPAPAAAPPPPRFAPRGEGGVVAKG